MTTFQPTDEQIDMIKSIAEANVKPQRAPVIGAPIDYGMEYQDVFFPSKDGVPLEGWFIPATNSNKLIICNHPATMSRTGFPGDLAPWSSFNPTKVNFHLEYKALHDAGYNILTYDMRNHGKSGQANGGISGTGQYEWRDVIGAFDYVNNHPSLANMTVSLLSRCMGGNATFVAMSKMPEYFKNVKALVCPQPASMGISVPKIIAAYGLDQPEHIALLDDEQVKAGGFKNSEMNIHPYVKHVKVPTYIVQVKDDVWSDPENDVQVTYELLELAPQDKKLHWIEETTQRFDGYNYLGEHPQSMIEWFDKYMA